MRSLVLTAVVAVATILACGGGTTVACVIDADCPSAFVCRAELCVNVGPDAGVLLPDDSGTGQSCAPESASCFTTSDCCTGSCTNGACSSAVVPVQPACVGVSGLCQNDCCDGLTCVKGVCQ